MDPETRLIYERMQLHDLMKQHPEWSQRQLARHLHHDPKWVRKWQQRLQATAAVTLNSFRSASRAPKSPPRRVAPEAKALIAQLRGELSERYHRPAGARTILAELRHYQQSQHPAFPLPRASSTITRLLREMGFIRPAPRRYHEPLLLPAPMEEWEMDFGQVQVKDGQVFEFFIVVDRGTSRLVYVEGGRGYNAESALEAVARLLLLHGLPQRLRFDRDPRLWGAWTRDSYPSPLLRFLRVVVIEPVVCPAHRPDKKPVVERTIYTLKYEWLARFSLDTVAEAEEALMRFPHYYNSLRPHQGRACGNRTPDEAFPTLPQLPTLPERVQADAWLRFYDGRVYRRRVSAAGTVQVDRHLYFVSSELAKQAVLLQLDAQEQCLCVLVDERVVKRLPLQGLYQCDMDLSRYLRTMKQEARLIEWHHHWLWEQTGQVL